MLIKLFTRDGGFVHQQDIPDMQPPPEIIAWGWRVFVRGSNYDGEIVFGPDGTPEVAYTEGLLYPLANTRKGDGQ